MLRDKRRNAVYFADYITDKKKAITGFTELLCKVEQQGTNPVGVTKCHIYLASFLRDLMVAYYSNGNTVDEIHQVFKQYLLHVQAQEELTYNEALNILSFAILLGEDVYTIFDSISFPEDDFLSILIAYNRVHEVLPSTPHKMYVPELTGTLVQCLRGEATANELKHFISEKWYLLNEDEAWYDSDKRSTGTYCGYWCFEGAAVAKMMNFDIVDFREVEYFPLDLI